LVSGTVGTREEKLIEPTVPLRAHFD